MANQFVQVVIQDNAVPPNMHSSYSINMFLLLPVSTSWQVLSEQVTSSLTSNVWECIWTSPCCKNLLTSSHVHFLHQNFQFPVPFLCTRSSKHKGKGEGKVFTWSIPFGVTLKCLNKFSVTYNSLFCECLLPGNLLQPCDWYILKVKTTCQVINNCKTVSCV
jgi:hypothetical protein